MTYWWTNKVTDDSLFLMRPISFRDCSLSRTPPAGIRDYEEIPHFLTEEIPHFLTAEIPHYKTRTAPKNSPCFSIRVRQYLLFYFYALYVVDLAVALDVEQAVFEQFEDLRI